ncbi:4-hydroxybenzoate octaprenyltransferase [Asaia krungthepensis]|uniref:4-hydroxybenzoate octaprenyltransferase n=1 Tax=Asaia krungthepensis NRIC 0535 TaxID=1307925 RepID=A0ABQ0Q5A8_9PROT|nr:4-hydroxybenzoate octaprenyltransferase [Asaia krungthepensis]GBQ92155.1 4-hydroxybenzoate polyprenyltransferase [Asaia krungthepensis NRIC 0535]
MTRQTVPHTDIRAHGWVARLPEGIRPYILLARLDRPVGTWLLLLPGIWGIELAEGSSSLHRAVLILLFAIGSLAMRSAGCVVNDIWDRKIDAQVARTAGRPLASGRLTVRQALVTLALLLAIGAFVLFQLPPLCWALAPLALLLVGLYPAAKRVTWWPQLVMGFTFGFGAPMGYAASAGRIDWVCALLYAGTILWQLGFDTIYGFQDMDDDARIGVRSTSRLWAGQARGFIGCCYGAALLLIATAMALSPLHWIAWPIAALAAFMLLRQIGRLDIRDPALCLALFRQNVPFGMVLALALICGRAFS